MLIDISVTRVKRLTVKRDLIGWAETTEAEAEASAKKVKRYVIGLCLFQRYRNEAWEGGKIYRFERTERKNTVSKGVNS